MKDLEDELTIFLNKASEGALETKEQELMQQIYQELKKMARIQLSYQYAKSTIQATELANESFLKLNMSSENCWQSRQHFANAASEACRRILIDRARAKATKKREGEHHAQQFDEELILDGIKPEAMIALDDALNDLKQAKPVIAQIIELKFFGGFKSSEIAELLDSSQRTIERQIQTGKAWLLTEINQP